MWWRTKSLVAVALSLAGSVGVLWVGSQVASAQTGQRPNVLIFVTDDQRYENTMWVMPKTNGTSNVEGSITRKPSR